MIAQNNKTIDQAEKHKEVVEENADKPDMMSQLISLAKWGLIFYGIKIIGETVGKKMSK